MTAEPPLPIGEVARLSGLSVSAIRYYEECGLVAAVERDGGPRRFGPEAIARLRLITTVQKAGFSLDEIRLLLTREEGAARRHDLVGTKLAEVRRAMRRLHAIEQALVSALECGCDSLEHCGAPWLTAHLSDRSGGTRQVAGPIARRRTTRKGEPRG